MSFDTVRPEDVGLSSARLAKIDGWMQRLVADRKLAGLSVAVLRRGELACSTPPGTPIWRAACRSRDDTLVRIYSMTKPLTSAAIMMLYEEGRFQLDDPITRFLPCFRQHARVHRRQPAAP